MTFLDRIKETSTSTGTGTFTLGGAVLGYNVFTNGTYKYCIVNETESEWEVGEGTVVSGVLTRTTIEASSNGGAAVSFSAGTKYVFNTVSAAYVNTLVPYTGATAAVNLGAYGLTSDYLQLSTSPTASGAVGRTLWNDQIGSTETTLKGGSVVLKNGVDLVARVVNKVTPAATLTKATYKAVRVSGAQGQRLAIAYAQANTDNNSADTIGLVCETIAQNQEGFIITVGQLTGINTTGSLQGETWADGDVLYLSPTTAGNLTNIKPTGATGHIVVIGYVEYSHAINGSIYVKIMNGWELDELHNVYINAVANNDVLVYESSSTLWKNKSIATILGYTPISLTSLSASAPLSYNNTTGVFSIAQATGSVNGFLSSTDWTTFNNKQAAITLTTTGTSGAATLVGNTLNIPQYSGGGISGSGTAGQVTYWSGTSAVTGSSNLFWDNTNGRLGIGTSSPGVDIDVSKSVGSSGTVFIRATNTSSTGEAGLLVRNEVSEYGALEIFGSSWVGATQRNLVSFTSGAANGFNIILYNNNANAHFRITSTSSQTERFRVFGNNGNVLIQNGGTFTDGGQRLQVIGSMRVGTTAASAMYWDDTNNRLGIGVTSPTYALDVSGTTRSGNYISGSTLSVSSSFSGLIVGNTITATVSSGNSVGIIAGKFITYSTSGTAATTFYFGTGISGNNATAVNDQIRFGLNSNIPTLIIGSSVGANTTGSISIGNNGGNFQTNQLVVKGVVSHLDFNGDKIDQNYNNATTIGIRRSDGLANGTLQDRIVLGTLIEANSVKAYVTGYNSGAFTLTVNTGLGNYTLLPITIYEPIQTWIKQDGTFGANINYYGNFVIGDNGVNDLSAQLQINSTSKGLLLPRMTTAQKTAITTPAAGLIVYDTSLNKLCLYTTTWETITSI